MLNLAITAVVAFATGWILHWGRSRSKVRRLEAECVRKLAAAEEQLALERLRLERRWQDAIENGLPTASLPPTAFEPYRDTHLARPRSAAPDSSTSRA